jgi:hypothetical protein
MWDNRVLDVSGGKDAEAQKVVVWKRHGGRNQKWKVQYVDQAKDAQKEGLVGDFGFYANRPFYFRSRMPMKRVAEAVGANNVQIRRYVKGRLGQQFYFDAVSKTIRS